MAQHTRITTDVIETLYKWETRRMPDNTLRQGRARNGTTRIPFLGHGSPVLLVNTRTGEERWIGQPIV